MPISIVNLIVLKGFTPFCGAFFLEYIFKGEFYCFFSDEVGNFTSRSRLS